MAGDWIKVRTNIHDDPAVIGVASLLAIDENRIVGALVKLWSWANQHTTDGNVISVTSAWVDRYTGLTGFAHALVKHGWLVLNETSITFPHFDRHNGICAKMRAETNRRVAKHRAAKANGKSHCAEPAEDVTADGALHSAAETASCNESNATREEKRRIEKRREEKTHPPNPPLGGTGQGECVAREEKKSPAASQHRPLVISDFPEQAAVVKRIIARYQEQVRPATPPGGANVVVLERLERDAISEEALLRAIAGYAEYCRLGDTAPQYRQSARVFFSLEGQHSAFLDWQPGQALASPLPAPRKKTAVEEALERTIKNPGGKPK